MKQLLSIGLLAVGVVLATERPAHAWINAKLSAGVNWHWQSGNNSLLWGLFRDGEVPGPEIFGGIGVGQPPHDGSCFYYGPPAATQYSATPASQGATQQTYFNTIPSWYNGNVFQPASYSNYATPTYATPNSYSPFSAPYYWYGR